MPLINLSLYTESLHTNVGVTVILPTTSGANAVYPTLYLLHGLGDDHTSWQRATLVERYASQYGIAVVMPGAGRSWYADLPNGDAYYTYLTKELPATCATLFRGIRCEKEYQYLAGNSMGGYGALKIGLAHPDRFAGIAAFSGAYHVRRYYENSLYLDRRGWDAVFSSPDAIPGSVHDVYGAIPYLTQAGMALPRLYISCGTQDGLLPDTERLHTVLQACGVPHRYHIAPGGHDWSFWNEELARALQFFFAKKQVEA